MAWTTPKTDWTEESFINSVDVNRWIGNLNYLRDLALHLYTVRINYLNTQEKVVVGSVVDDRWQGDTDADIHLYADEMNEFESKLTEINNGTLEYDIGDEQTYRDNGYMPDYTELNRIENAMLRLYTEMTIQIANSLDRLSFVLGGERKFKI